MNASHARLALVLSTCLIASCQRNDDTPAAAQIPKPDAAGFTVVEWALPTTDGAAQPDLVVAPNGSLLLSWVRPMGDRHAFQYAAYLGDDNWESAPKTIAVGRALAANWANTPHILMTDDGALWAQWLQAHPGGSEHAADVVLTQSRDGGMHWMAPVAVNDDGSASEHGFVSLWPSAQDAVGIAWLDGRKVAAGTEHMQPGDTHAAHHADGAAMTLRAANFDATMARSGEVEIDPMTCDCCSTDAAVTADGALLVYRDRDIDEIRDIVAVRRTAQGWSKPQPVHADHWKMPACPLNGPAVDARGNEVVVAWYSAPDDQPVLQLARSHDGGAHFDAPVEIDRGEAVAGRVDVALDGDAAWLLWLREDGKGQSLQVARQAGADAKPQRSVVAPLRGRGRATGYPQIAVRQGVAHAVWTDIVDGVPRLRGARMKAGTAPAASR